MLQITAQATVTQIHASLRDDIDLDIPMLTAALQLLSVDPRGAAHLARAVDDCADAATKVAVAAIVARVAADFEEAARQDNALLVLPALQTTAYGLCGAGALAMAIGTLSPGIGSLFLGGVGIGAVAVTWSRSRQAREESRLKRDAALIEALIP